MKYFTNETSHLRERTKRQKVLLKELLLDYAKNTTLHGIRYIVDKTLTIVERLFWLLTFILSLGLCFLLIRDVWIKWETSPVIVSFSQKFIPAEMVPFPSITICPEVKVRAALYNLTNEYEKYVKHLKRTNLTDDEIAGRKKLQDVSLICQLDDLMNQVKTGRLVTNSSIIRTFREVAPSIEDYMFICSWRGNSSVPCSDLFSMVITDEGVCFNFNSLSTNEVLNTENLHKDFNYSDVVTPSHGWSLSDGYSNQANPYPRRGMGSRGIPELLIIFKIHENDNDRLCNIVNKGFKVYVQHPADHPQSSQHHYAALPDRSTSLGLEFTMITTTDSLKDYSPKVRQCYFPSERKLKYFNIYSANNCMLECYTNYTLEKCGCVAFYMPYNNSEIICTSEQQSCVSSARVDFSERLIDQYEEENDPCSCLPACDSIDYDAVNIVTDYDFKDILRQLAYIQDKNLGKYLENVQYSRLDVYFKKPRFVSIQRSELFGLTDFLASCGGLVGLCLGFSFLSLVEIIYFFTLRCGLLLKKDLDEENKSVQKPTSSENIPVEEMCRL